MSKLVVFGLGYTAQVFARRMTAKGWRVHGTSRGAEQASALRARGFEMSVFTGNAPDESAREALRRATHVLVSIAPGAEGDCVLSHHADDLKRAENLQWIGYLSTVGVYGDHGGAQVDEDTALKPKSERSVQRVAAEEAWAEFGARTGKAVHIFRLAGIYGPGRGPLEKVRRGEGRRIVKRAQVFNRIHVEDIASVLEASLLGPNAGRRRMWWLSRRGRWASKRPLKWRSRRPASAPWAAVSTARTSGCPTRGSGKNWA